MLLLALPAVAQQAGETPVFTSDVRWVRLDVQAGEKNRLLSDLKQEDFIVYDEDQPQPVLYFGRETEPLDVLLLLDISGSMHRYLEQITETARAALGQLGPQDRVGVMIFSRRAEVVEDLTTDFGKVEQKLRAAVRSEELGSGTLINPAVLSAANYMRDQPLARDGNGGPKPGRRAILMMTDNRGLNYQTPDDLVIRALFDADTVLNAIVVGKGERPRERKPGEYANPDFTPSNVFRIAEETGGEAVKAERAGATFRQMLESIRSRYSIQYRVPDGAVAGAFRRVRVELAPEARKRYPKGWIRVRSGYTVTR